MVPKREYCIAIYDKSGARKRGHYKLSAGGCAKVYFDMWELYHNPMYAFEVCKGLAQLIIDHCQSEGIPLPDFIGGPARGAIWIAQLTAIHITLITGHDVKAIFVEKDPKRPGEKHPFIFTNKVWERYCRGMRGVVVEDVTTTLESAAVSADLFHGAGAEVILTTAMVSRDSKLNAESARSDAFVPLTVIDTPKYTAENCPVHDQPYDNDKQ